MVQMECDVCSKLFRTHRTLLRHHATMHPDIPAEYKRCCNICTGNFTDPIEYNNHLSSHKHCLQCVVCKFVTTTKSSLKKHTDLHRLGKHFCIQCNVFYEKGTSHTHGDVTAESAHEDSVLVYEGGSIEFDISASVMEMWQGLGENNHLEITGTTTCLGKKNKLGVSVIATKKEHSFNLLIQAATMGTILNTKLKDRWHCKLTSCEYMPSDSSTDTHGQKPPNEKHLNSEKFDDNCTNSARIQGSAGTEASIAPYNEDSEALVNDDSDVCMDEQHSKSNAVDVRSEKSNKTSPLKEMQKPKNVVVRATARKRGRPRKHSVPQKMPQLTEVTDPAEKKRIVRLQNRIMRKSLIEKQRKKRRISAVSTEKDCSDVVKDNVPEVQHDNDREEDVTVKSEHGASKEDDDDDMMSLTDRQCKEEIMSLTLSVVPEMVSEGVEKTGDLKDLDSSEMFCVICMKKLRRNYWLYFCCHLDDTHFISVPDYLDVLRMEASKRPEKIEQIKKRQVEMKQKYKELKYNVKKEEMIQCISCFTILMSINSYGTHIRSVHKEDKNYDKLVKHFEDIRDQKNNSSSKATKLPPIVITCDYCGVEKIGVNGIKVHTRLAHADQPNFKEKLEKYREYSKIETLRLRRIHYHEALKEKKDEFPCRHCKEPFAFRSSRGRHEKFTCLKNPNRLRTFTCTVCEARFLTKEELTNHKQRHRDDDTKFVCDICGKIRRTKAGMYEHKNSKHGKKPPKHTCPYCPKRFFNKDRLQSHVTTHSDHRAFQCEMCGSNFKTRAAVLKHQATMHLNKYPYYCEKCGHGMAKIQYLNAHKCGRIRRSQGSDTVAHAPNVINSQAGCSSIPTEMMAYISEITERKTNEAEERHFTPEEDSKVIVETEIATQMLIGSNVHVETIAQSPVTLSYEISSDQGVEVLPNNSISPAYHSRDLLDYSQSTSQPMEVSVPRSLDMYKTSPHSMYVTTASNLNMYKIDSQTGDVMVPSVVPSFQHPSSAMDVSEMYRSYTSYQSSGSLQAVLTMNDHVPAAPPHSKSHHYEQRDMVHQVEHPVSPGKGQRHSPVLITRLMPLEVASSQYMNVSTTTSPSQHSLATSRHGVVHSSYGMLLPQHAVINDEQN